MLFLLCTVSCYEMPKVAEEANYFKELECMILQHQLEFSNTHRFPSLVESYQNQITLNIFRFRYESRRIQKDISVCINQFQLILQHHVCKHFEAGSFRELGQRVIQITFGARQLLPSPQQSWDLEWGTLGNQIASSI